MSPLTDELETLVEEYGVEAVQEALDIIRDDELKDDEAG